MKAKLVLSVVVLLPATATAQHGVVVDPYGLGFRVTWRDSHGHNAGEQDQITLLVSELTERVGKHHGWMGLHVCTEIPTPLFWTLFSFLPVGVETLVLYDPGALTRVFLLRSINFSSLLVPASQSSSWSHQLSFTLLSLPVSRTPTVQP